MKSRHEQLIKLLGLTGHPEGGFFRETYRSPVMIEGRNLSTAIFFLLVHPETSRFHRLQSDELWHFHEGSPVVIHMINEAGDYSMQLLGQEIDRGQSYLAIIPRGTWFAAEVVGNSGYALMSCTVAPGFDFRDFELAGRDDLTKRFSAHGELIRRLT